jgi:hypothetical protein
MGCGGNGQRPDVPAGQFEATVEGTVSDTLSGPVHYRAKGDSLVGMELGPRDGPGLSIELESQPPALRTYEVTDAELFGTPRTDSSSGVMAFLTTGEARFTATDGTLELTYVGDEQVGATFDFQMEGEFVGEPRGAPSVEVTGMLSAPAER